MRAAIQETEDARTVLDEHGDEWDIVADDGCGHLAVERDAGERWDAGQFATHGGNGELYQATQPGAEFGVNCQGEYVLESVDNAGSLRWVEQAE